MDGMLSIEVIFNTIISQWLAHSSSIPVSYTHLDVYKRQHTHTYIRNGNFNNTQVTNEQLYFCVKQRTRTEQNLSLIHI